MSKQYTYRQYLEAVVAAGGSRTQAAKNLGIGIRALYRGLAILRKRGEEVPPSPHVASREVHPLEQVEESHENSAPDGYKVKGVSTLRDGEGNVVAEWTKTEADREQQLKLLREVVDALKAEIPPQPALLAPQYTTSARLCNLFVITDYHLGMLAWRHEGGADWDLDIAERTLVAAFSHLMRNSPKAKRAIVCNLGDFMHTDGFLPLTPASKHVLDADSRFPKMVNVAARVLRRLANMALLTHEEVWFLIGEGNHDPASSVWLRELFSMLFADEPRIKVETTPLPYYAYQHGKTMLAFHHGHLRKHARLQGLFAAQFPAMWGSTEYRYGHCGHLHHKHEKEDDGMTVIQHNTLAARDAYAARGGWIAERSAQCITYDVEHGEVARTVVKPEMLVDAIKSAS